MKKRTSINFLLAVSGMMVFAAGCSKSDSAMRALEERAGIEADSGRDQKKDTDEDREEPESAEKEKGSGIEGGAMIGDDCSGYDGFQYLKEYQMVKLTDGDEDTLPVFLPKEDAYVDETYGVGYTDGLTVTVEMNPYFVDARNGASAAENLELYLEELSTPYFMVLEEGLTFSRIQSAGDIAWVKADFAKYDSYSEQFDGHSEYYILVDSEDFNLLVDIDLIPAWMTAESEDTLKELFSFYGVDTEFNAEEAERFLNDFTADPEVWEEQQIVVNYDLLMTIPRDWQPDYNFDRENTDNVYAGGGNAKAAESYLRFRYEYMGSSPLQEFERMLEKPEIFEQVLGEETLGDQTDLSFSRVDTVTLGNTLLIEGELDKDGSPAVSRTYIGYIEDCRYELQIVQTKDAQEDAMHWLEEFLQGSPQAG